MFAYFGMPGPLEIAIVGLVCIAPLAALAIVLVFLFTRKQSPPASAPCRHCNGWTVPGTRFCPHCGNPIEGPSQQP